jgi:hypothetical protein
MSCAIVFIQFVAVRGFFLGHLDGGVVVEHHLGRWSWSGSWVLACASVWVIMSLKRR